LLTEQLHGGGVAPFALGTTGSVELLAGALGIQALREEVARCAGLTLERDVGALVE
jgi:hypothetical protein